MIDIEKALNFPFEGGDWLRKAVIGSILAFASLFVLPAPLLLGYLMRVMREESMPEFDNLIQMYLEGVVAFGLAILYMMPGIAIMAAFESSYALVGLPVVLVMYYSLESGFYQLANNGFRQALSVQVLKDAFTLKYLVGLLVSIFVSLALVIAWSLTSMLILPILLFPAVTFYQNVFRFRIMKEAIEAE